MKVFFIVFTAFALTILFNILIYKLIVYSALKNYIKPYLKDCKVNLHKHNFTGFLNIGAYGKRTLEFVFVPELGNIFNDTYINLVGTDQNSLPVKYTAKISTVFLIIKKVEIKQENAKPIRLK